MSAIFLSDVHLVNASSVKTQLVLRFLQEEASRFERIYILGDLFDVWPGTNPFLLRTFEPVIQLLKNLVSDGHVVSYVEGNHDFRLGEYFTEQVGLRVFPRFIEERLGGKKVFLAHGDLGNPKQLGYRVLRKILRMDSLHLAASFFPSEWVYNLGAKTSRLSRDYNTRSAEVESEIRQIYRKSAESLFVDGYDVVIMGHTHIPDAHNATIKGRLCQYFNTGDWVKHFTYLEFDGHRFYTRVHDVAQATSHI